MRLRSKLAFLLAIMLGAAAVGYAIWSDLNYPYTYEIVIDEDNFTDVEILGVQSAIETMGIPNEVLLAIEYTRNSLGVQVVSRHNNFTVLVAEKLSQIGYDADLVSNTLKVSFKEKYFSQTVWLRDLIRYATIETVFYVKAEVVYYGIVAVNTNIKYDEIVRMFGPYISMNLHAILFRRPGEIMAYGAPPGYVIIDVDGREFVMNTEPYSALQSFVNAVSGYDDFSIEYNSDNTGSVTKILKQMGIVTEPIYYDRVMVKFRDVKYIAKYGFENFTRQELLNKGIGTLSRSWKNKGKLGNAFPETEFAIVCELLIRLSPVGRFRCRSLV